MWRTNKHDILDCIVILVLLIGLVLLTISCLMSGMIPTAYIIIADLIFIGLIASFIIFRESKIVHLILVTVLLISSVGTTLLSIILFGANKELDTLLQTEIYYDQVVVVVANDSPINSINEFESIAMVGIAINTQSSLMKHAVNILKDTYDMELKVVEFDSLIQCAHAVLRGNVDIMVYNLAYEELLNDAFEGEGLSLKTIFSINIPRGTGYNDIIVDTSIDSTTRPISPEPIVPPTTVKPDFTEPENPNFTKDTFAIYMSGIDVYGAINRNSRSDVNIICIVNPSENKILLVTTPRDYFVEIPGVSNGVKDKLTHAGIYGVDASMRTLSNLYGIELNYYFRVNFTSFVNIVDALGGITVESERDFSVDGYHYLKGPNILDGAAALRFVRERKSFADGDHQRGRHQQAAIKAIIEKACSPAILNAADEILESVRDNIDTNIQSDLIKNMIRKQLMDGKSWDIQMVAATGSGSYSTTYSMPDFSAWVMIPNENSVNAIKDRIKEYYN